MMHISFRIKSKVYQSAAELKRHKSISRSSNEFYQIFASRYVASRIHSNKKQIVLNYYCSAIRFITFKLTR